MFWIIRKLFWLGVLVAIIYYGAQFKIDDKPIKEYAKEFYQSPLVQEVLKSGKEMIREFWNDKVEEKPTPSEGVLTRSAPVDDELTREDQEALDRVLEQQQ